MISVRLSKYLAEKIENPPCYWLVFLVIYYISFYMSKSNENSDDCLIKYGLVAKSNERKSKIQIENIDEQSDDLVEEIHMIISLIISHQFQNRYLHDDFNPYDAIYACLLDKSRKKPNYFNVHLRDRFMNLKSYDKLKIFRENERKRKRKTCNRTHLR